MKELLEDRSMVVSMVPQAASLPARFAPENASPTLPTREDWLRRAVGSLRSAFLIQGAPLPEPLQVSVGFPSTGGLRRKTPRIGECWAPQASQDGRAQLFVSPVVSDSRQVLAVLLHELVHAAVGPEAGHGPRFRRVAVGLGLTGKMTATVAGPELLGRLDALQNELGPFPHAAIVAIDGRKKQRTRLLKVECPGCGYTARVTALWIAVGLPVCPCGERMRLNGTPAGAELPAPRRAAATML